MERKKICIVATVPFAINAYMKPHVMMLSKKYLVTIMCSGVEQDFSDLKSENIYFRHIDINRKIKLWSDLLVFLRLLFFFRSQRFDVVHSIMPKAGFLAMLAAFLSGTPHRIHSFTGQVWANKAGMSRFFLRLMDFVVAWCATGVLTDSQSQLQFIVSQSVVGLGKVGVLANGSICGVNTARFKPNLNSKTRIRSSLQIPTDSIVYLFLGRLNSDKGLLDLAVAFGGIASLRSNVYLLIVGPDEENMRLKLTGILSDHIGKYSFVGLTKHPEDYMSAADIFCLPSYREGFGSVIIEAAASGAPAVASRIYGIVDAVEDGVTGILHEPGNVEEIKQALFCLADDELLREKMKEKAMERALKLFNQKLVVKEMSNFYKTLFI